MTSQGIRARIAANEVRRVFAVSQVRLGIDGQIADLWWAEVNARSNLDAATPAVVSVAEAVLAIHEGHQVVASFPRRRELVPARRFVLRENGDGRETIALEGPRTAAREVADLT